MALMEIPDKKQFETLERARTIVHADDARQMTALAVADTLADVVCLQEVENLAALETFEDNYLYRMTGISYPQKAWIEGNDGRGIDVAFMARERTMDGEPIEIDRIRSHAKSTFSDLGVHNATLEEMGLEADERIFRRDCLEVNLRVGGRRVTLFVCHFKSMGPFRNGMTGREYTMPVRIAESRAVKRIIERKFGSERTPKMRWAIVGDLNDYTERLVVTGDRIKGYSFESKREGVSGIDPLLTDGFSHNLMDLRPADDRWTLYHAAGPVDDLQKPEERETRHLVQLDYLLLSPALAKQNAKSVPEIIRQGLPFRTIFPPHLDVPRYPRTGWDRPKASDHCPVVMKLTL